ncbi:MAG: hypothetical protein FJW34_13670 [Acidobacteria bacterium]|nr:hypothetical protein [Acidobacteriota bacterium]
MTRRILSIVTLGCLLALVAAAAGIDGQWVATMKVPAPKKQGGEPREVQFTLDLKSDGGKITGSVSGGTGRRAPTMTVDNGKIQGDKFSFTTTQKSRQGQERKFNWEGTIQGDELRGARTPDGARRGVEFTARRQ